MNEKPGAGKANLDDTPKFVHWTGLILAYIYWQLTRGPSLIWNIVFGFVVAFCSVFIVNYVYFAFRPIQEKLSGRLFYVLGTLFYLICDSALGIIGQLLQMRDVGERIVVLVEWESGVQDPEEGTAVPLQGDNDRHALVTLEQFRTGLVGIAQGFD